MRTLTLPPSIGRRMLVIAFVAITLALLGGGCWIYRAQVQAIRQGSCETIASIATMKEVQIAQWRKERLMDVMRESHSPVLIDALEKIASNANTPETRDRTLKVMELARNGEMYSRVIALSTSGQVLLSVGDTTVSVAPSTQRAIAAALLSPGGVITDFFRTSGGEVAIDTVAAVRGAEGSVLGFIVLQSPAADCLYPLIQSWPTPSRSAETILVERDGENVVFLNELRHRSNTALSYSHSLKQVDMPAVQAALGHSGMVDGKDYRQVRVLADLRAIPGTPWYMVTKVDAAEIMAEVGYRAPLIGIIIGAFILLAAVFIAYVYRRMQVDHLRQVVELERHQRETLELFRTTLYSIGDGVITTDTEGRIQAENPMAERFTGWTESEAQGKHLDEVFVIINQETRTTVTNPVSDVLRKGVVVGLANHTLLIARDGTEYAIADSTAPIRDESGVMIGVVLVFSDVTELYHSQELLRKREREYHGLFQGMMEGFALHEIICDKSGKPVDYRFLSINPAFERMTGLNAENVIGRTVMDVIPENESLWIERYGRVALTGEPDHFEEYSHPLNRHFKIEVFSLQVGQFVTVFEDITERKRAEAALCESEAIQRLLMDNLPAGVVIVDPVTRCIERVNDYVAILFGTSSDQLVGQRCHSVLCPVSEGACPVCDLEGSVDNSERVMLRKDGSRLPILKTVKRIQINGQEKLLECFVDISERKQLEEKLLRSERMESVGRLAAGVSHDLNNILTPIILSAEMLRAVDEPETRECLISSIEQCAQRGAAVVDQVLTFVRGTKGELTTLPLNGIVSDMEKIMKETFPKNIAITSALPSDLWPVKADSTQLHQVLLNLCINARDAMPEGGNILITGENVEIDENFAAMSLNAKVGDYAVLKITDTGTGIAPAIISKIFEPFFTTKETGKGTGLGLSTAIGIVRSHGGFVTVSSELGHGATFNVFLPRETGGIVEQRRFANMDFQPGNGETILVVEDEELIAKVAAIVLEKNGYKVLAASSGAEALALYENHANEINVILTDIMMPEMDGLQLSRSLKKINPEAKIIASTGQATEAQKSKLRALGVHVILHKPYDAKKLLATLHEAIHEERA